MNLGYNGTEIAVIGMSGKFPGAKNVTEFWSNLKEGKESIRFFQEEELIEEGIEPEQLSDPRYVKAYGWLEGAEDFDHAFFQYNEKEALMMDPQIRLLHEIVWEALEDAGYNPDIYAKRVGLYVGASDNLYWQVLSTLSHSASTSEQFESFCLNNKDFIATQVAYKCNLKGPAVTVSSACSTSLTAIHLASQSLLSGECEIALAGGVTISLPAKKGYLYEDGMILSPDGHCRPFDEAGTGIVGGNGGGIVVLKLLEDALADGDHIYAIIKGTAINNDGSRKVGYTAPSLEGQVEVVRFAHKVAEVEADTITYVEAHGTGTKLGDPVEVEALKQAFQSTKKNFCAIGSVKSNIGHLDAAAGVAGFIKTVLMLKHREIPPTLNVSKANAAIDFQNSPFYLNTTLQPWKDNGFSRRASVTALGIGGTNAHIVLEESPVKKNRTVSGSVQLIPLSAQTPEQLHKIIDNLRNFLEHNPHCNLDDIGFTLQNGRKNMAIRKTFVCTSTTDLIAQLSRNVGVSKKIGHSVKTKDASVVFMFPGQGSQYLNMGAGLLSSDVVFRNELEYCLGILHKASDLNFSSIWYGPSGATVQTSPSIRDTSLVQPFLFAFEFALAKSLMTHGVKPKAMIGHSLGEYVAACLAGVFSLEDALHLLVIRGRLMNHMVSGAMLSIVGSEEDIRSRLDHRYSIAAVNSDHRVVVSALDHDIEELEQQLTTIGVPCKKLHTSHAFHSVMTEAILDEFYQALNNVTFHGPNIPFISNLTGTWITTEQATSPSYWCQQMRNSVLFRDGLTTLLKEGEGVFLEIGPGNTLGSFLLEHREKQAHHYAVNMVRHVNEEIDDEMYFVKSIGRAWSLGVNICWASFFDTAGKERMSLPTYPFAQNTFSLRGNPYKRLIWNEVADEANAPQKESVENWVYVPVWKDISLVPYKASPESGQVQQCYMVFLTRNKFGERLKQWLGSTGNKLVLIYPGDEFQAIDDRTYVINPERYEDYATLFQHTRSFYFTQVLHTWMVTEDTDSFDFFRLQEYGLYSIVYLAKVLASSKDMTNLAITTVSNQICQVYDEKIIPEKATLLGAIKVIPQENPLLSCRHIDVQIPDEEDAKWNQLLERIWGEMDSPSEKVIAYRGKKRWVQTFEQIKVQKLDKITPSIREKGVYFVTGGLGRIGLFIAEHLTSTYQANVALLTRSAFPKKRSWDQWLATHDSNDPISKIIHRLRLIEAYGGEIRVCQVDVSDAQQLAQVTELIEQEWGAINGLIHAAAETEARSSQCFHQELKAEDFVQQFKAKVFGTKAIEQVFRGKSLDFYLLFSSLASVLGGLGFTAYAAANQFLDSFALQKRSESEVPWVSINWDSWSLDDDNTSSYVMKEKLDKRSIHPEEGLKILGILTTWTGAQTAVSTYNLQTRMNQWILLKDLQDVNHIEETVDNLEKHDVFEKDVESIITGIWKEQLGGQEIDLDKSFFELGGDSLKALTIITQIQKKLKRKIELHSFYDYPTISGLAKILNEQMQDDLYDIPVTKEKEYYSVTSSQERLFILNQMHPDSVSYNLPQAMMIEGPLDVEKLKECFIKLAHRHEALRTSFHLEKGRIVQRIHETIDLDFTYKDISEDQLLKAVVNFVRPFSLEVPGLIRVCIFKIEAEKFLLAMDIHHIISDGISFKILWEEMIALHENQELPEQTLRYRDYCDWEKSPVANKFLENQKAFWMDKLQAAPELILPTDYAKKDTIKYWGDTISFEWEEEMSRRVNDFVKENRITKFVFFLAAFNILLAKLSGQEDIVVGTPIAGRNHPKLGNIFGHFINILPLRSNPLGAKTFRDYVFEVSNHTIEAFENQNFTYKNMVEALQVKWNVNQNPLFDVMIIMQNIENKQMQLPGLTFTPYPLKSKTTKFNITLEIFEHDGKFSFLFEYCTELFKKQTSYNFTNYYTKIVQYVLDHQDCFISEIKFSSVKSIDRMSQAIAENLDSFWD